MNQLAQAIFWIALILIGIVALALYPTRLDCYMGSQAACDSINNQYLPPNPERRWENLP